MYSSAIVFYLGAVTIKWRRVMTKTAKSADGSLIEGKKAPDFALKDDNGETVKLSELKGKTVVLYFYPKDDTPGCTKEACSFRDGFKEIQKKGAVILGVSPDSVGSHKKFKEKFKLNFPLLSDDEKKVVNAYGVWKQKSLYGRKYMGTARVTFVINEAGIIEEVIEKVNTKNHSAQILQDEKEKVKQDKKPAAKVAAKKKASAKVSRSGKDTRKK